MDIQEITEQSKVPMQMLARASSKRERVRISGRIVSLVFRNPEDDWSVMTVQVGRAKVRVVGHTAAIEGQEICAEGHANRIQGNQWNTGALYEVKSERIVASTPRSDAGIASFLAANVRGVGPTLAKRLSQAFAGNLCETLDERPQFLQNVKGITPTIYTSILERWREQRATAEIQAFLFEQDISPAMCRRIYRKWGDKAKALLCTNPYQLCSDIHGIGFAKADAIAQRLAIPKASAQRIQAGILHALDESRGSGHCGMEQNALIEKSASLLGLHHDLIKPQILALLQDKRIGDGPEKGRVEKAPLAARGGIIWLRHLLEKEEAIAKRLLEMTQQDVRWSNRLKELDSLIAQAQKAASITLAPAQVQAVRMCLSERVSIITGGPGCGKTTTLNVALDVMKRLRIKVALAAPTGKAAQRAAEATGEQAATLHRMLRIAPDGAQNEIDADVLVIDECSMLDVSLCHQMVSGINPRTNIVFVGDVDQLQSVGAGAVLLDLISSERIPCTRLSVIFRQGAGSLIKENAHLINAGQKPIPSRKGGDFFLISEERDERLRQAIKSGEPSEFSRAAQSVLRELVCERLPKRYGFDPVADIMVLSPMNNGHCGVRALNPLLQDALNPSGQEWKYGSTQFRVGDKVMQIRNNYTLGVFNGETAMVRAIDTEQKLLLLDYGDRMVEHGFEDADELRHAYCITIHKSQGSQAPCVVIPVLTEHYTMLARSLLYTGVTRAQKLCVLIGSERAVGIAVRNASASRRTTSLGSWLRA